MKANFNCSEKIKAFFTFILQISDDNLEEFLEGWKDNRVRAIFFGPKEEPSLRFLAPAFANQDRIACGYVYTGSADINKLARRYSINKHRETLLMWNEVTDQTVASISMQQLPRSTIDEVLSGNRYLVLPRLSSQAVFDELCPEQPKIRRRQLCVALVSKKAEFTDQVHSSFREFAQNSRMSSKRVRFAYIYEDVQKYFIKTLTQGNETRSQNVREVVILWRTDTRKLNYEFIKNGWNLDKDYLPKSRRELEKRLTELLEGNDLLPYRATIPEFYNEHMLGLMTRIFYRFVDWYDRAYYYATGHDGMTLLSVLGVIAFIGFTTLSMKKLANAEMEQVKREKKKEKTQKRPPSCTPETQTIHLYELRAETFQNLVADADTGLTVTLLVDEASKEKLMRRFAEIMQPVSKYSGLTFAFLQMEYYLDWYRHLLELTMDFNVKLDNINNRNCVGSVLAINGYRKCYYIYHPRTARRWMRKQHGGTILKAVGFGDSDSESDDDDQSNREENVLFEHELLSGLSIWMDRVFDGSVKKVRLPYWPQMAS